MSDSFGFASALFESIGIPEIVVYDRDMKDPARVVERFQEIVRDGKAGVDRVCVRQSSIENRKSHYGTASR
jgi:hypothetical protein